MLRIESQIVSFRIGWWVSNTVRILSGYLSPLKVEALS
jgi:hypothetical protein